MRDGALTSTETKLRKNLRDIITADQYKNIITRLITIATDGKRDLDAVNAAKIIIDRLEGQIPVALPIKDEIKPTITKDDLNTIWDKYQSKQNE